MSGAIVETVDGEVRVTCPATAARCRCRHEPGHPPPHECTDRQVCDGAWRGSDHDGGTVEPVRFPLAGGIGRVMDDLFGLTR